jgi:hypothetical protein
VLDDALDQIRGGQSAYSFSPAGRSA